MGKILKSKLKLVCSDDYTPKWKSEKHVIKMKYKKANKQVLKILTIAHPTLSLYK